MTFYWNSLLVLCLFQMATLLTQSASVPIGFQQAGAGPTSRRLVYAGIKTIPQPPSQEFHKPSKLQNIAANSNNVRVFLTLKTRKSISSEKETLRRLHSIFRRQQYRTLIFRYRIYRITRNRRILVSRISKLRIQYKAEKQLLLSFEANLRVLTQKFNLFPKNARISQNVRNRLTLEIQNITARIKTLKRKTASIKQRILRASARQRRMGRRIAILQQRLQRQIRVGIRATLEISRVLSRLKIFTTYAKSTVNKAAKKVPKSKSNAVRIYIPKSMSSVLNIINTVKAFHTKILHEYGKFLTSSQRIKKYKDITQGLEARLTKLSRKTQLTGKAHLQHLRQTILQIKQQLAQLRSTKRDEENKLAHNKNMVKLTTFNCYIYLKKYGLDYSDASRHGAKWIVRDQRRIIRRVQRRKKLQAKYKVLIRRVSSAGNVLSRTARRLVKQQASRIYRTERKRIVKRVVKRVKRIENRIKHAIHKAKIVHQRKLHIQRRQHRLERRAHRIISREGRIKQTIANEESKYIRLVRRLNHLKLNKKKLGSQGKSANITHRTDTQIKQTLKKVTDHLKLINKLKKRRIHILSRLHRINIKKQRLRDRLTAIRQRSQRNRIKIQKLVSTEKKFVRRVVKKRLISRRVIQRVVTPIPRIILDQKLALLRFRKKAIIHLRKKQSISGFNRRLKRVHEYLNHKIYRILSLRYRIYLIKHNRRKLGQRIKYLVGKEQLLRSLKPNSAHKRKSLLKSILRFRSYIGRLSARRQRMLGRISLLRHRVKRQLRGVHDFYERFGRLLAQMRIYGPRQIAKHIRNLRSNGRSSASGKLGNVFEPRSRAEVELIMSKVKDIHAKLVRISLINFASLEKVRRYERIMDKLQSQFSKLYKESSISKSNLKLRHEIKKITSKIVYLNAEKTRELKTYSRNTKRFLKTALSHSKIMLGYGINLISAWSRGHRVISRAKQRIRRRERRRRQLQAQHKILLRRIARARHISAKAGQRLIQLHAHRIYSGERKRIAKRILARVKRIQKRFQSAVHNAFIISQRKLHIEKRRLLLRRRFYRIRTKSQRISQLIAKAKVGHKQLPLIKKLKKRIVQMRIQLRKIKLSRLRLRQRLSANESRMQRNRLRLQRLMAAKKWLINTSLKRKLISRTTIKRAFESGRHKLSATQLRSASNSIKNRQFYAPHHSSRERFSHRIHRHQRVRVRGLIHLRNQKSIDALRKKMKRLFDGLVRDMIRTLAFRRRIHDEEKQKHTIGSKINTYFAQKRVIQNKLFGTDLKRKRLVVRLKSISADRRTHRGVLRQMRIKILNYTRRIEKGNEALRRLNRRISRLSARRNRLNNRILMNRLHKRQQSRDAERYYAEVAKLLARWKIYDTREQLPFFTPIYRLKDLKPASKADIQKFKRLIKHLYSTFLNVTIRRFIYRQRLASLENYNRKLQRELSRLSPTRSSLGRQSRRSHQINHMISTQLANLKTKVIQVQSEIKQLGIEQWITVKNIRKTLLKYRLNDYVRADQRSVHVFAKVKRRVQRRERRREIHIAQHKRLVRRIARARGISVLRASRMAKLHISRSERRRVARRAVKRVKRIQRRLKQIIKQAKTVQKSKQHIKQRQRHLKRRARRVSARRRQLRRQIQKALVKHKLLISRLHQVQLSKKNVRLRVGSSNAAAFISHINSKATKIKNTMSRHRSLVTKLQRRASQLSIRLQNIHKAQRGLQKRLSLIRRRARRNQKRLQRLKRTKQRFVRRVIRKRLVSRRVIKIITTPKSSRPILRVKSITAKILHGRPIIRLRKKKTYSDFEKKMIQIHIPFCRLFERTLIFRYRTYRIQNKRKVLGQNIKKLIVQRRTLKSRILAIKLRRQSVLRQLKSLSKGFVKTAFQHQLERLVKSLTISIEKTTRKLLHLKQRIVRISDRRKRMLSRIVLLRQREKRQLKEVGHFFILLRGMLLRTKAYGPKRMVRGFKFAWKIRKSSRDLNFNKPQKVYQPTSRADVDRAMTEIRSILGQLLHFSSRSIYSRTKITKYNKNIKILQVKSQNLLRRMRESSRRMSRISRLELRHRIGQISSEVATLTEKKRLERKRFTRLQTTLHPLVRTYSKILLKYSIDHMPVERIIMKKFHKLNQRLRRRELKIRGAQAQHNKLIRRITRNGGISTRTARRLVRRHSRRVYRVEKRRLVKRVVKRVKLIQTRFEQAKRKVKIIQQRKMHIQQRRLHLRRRIYRIRARKQRLKQKILTASIKLQHQVRSLKHLVEIKQKYSPRLINGKVSSQVNNINRINSQMQHVAKKVAFHKARVTQLKGLNQKIKIRLQKLALKQHRLRSRMSAINRRAERQSKRVQRLVIKKKQFIKRVVKKRLISRRTVKRIVKPKSDLLRPVFASKLASNRRKDSFADMKRTYHNILKKHKWLSDSGRDAEENATGEKDPGNAEDSDDDCIESSETQKVNEKPRNAEDSANGVIESTETHEVNDPEKPGNAEDSGNGHVIESSETQEVNEPGEEEIVHE